jgi:cytochrome c peroxidase
LVSADKSTDAIAEGTVITHRNTLLVLGLGDEGLFKTPTLRNVTKNQLGITKAFMHNGYFKKVEDVVHYYNTRFSGTALDTTPGEPTDKRICEDIGLPDATAAEAIANNCWPVPEFPGTTVVLGGLLGNLGLTSAQEAAVVAYIRTLEDSRTPTAPSTVK